MPVNGDSPVTSRLNVNAEESVNRVNVELTFAGHNVIGAHRKVSGAVGQIVDGNDFKTSAGTSPDALQ